MTRFGHALFVALVPLALCAQEKKDDKKDEKKEEPKTITFTSKEGKFSVLLPGKPKEDTKKVKVDDRDADHHIFTAGQKDRAQLVTYLDYLKETIGEDKEKFLAERLARNIAFLKGKVASEEKLTIGKQKFPARDVVVEVADKKHSYRARLVLAGNRLYQVVALGPDEFVKSKDVDEFFKSFVIDE
jgi:hypothetical protein